LPDGLEIDHNLDPCDASDGLLDTDGDGLKIAKNMLLDGTNPFNSDYDGDALTDGEEVGYIRV
jgi:hypothetical protein